MKNDKNQGWKLSVAVLPLCLALLTSCGAAVEDGNGNGNEDQPGDVAESLTFPVPTPYTCASRAPDAVITRRGLDGVFRRTSSPTKYGVAGCEKSWIVDLPPNPDGSNVDTNLVSWADPWERNRAQCLTGTLKLTVFSRGPGELLARNDGSFEAPLIWNSADQHCDYPLIHYGHTNKTDNYWLRIYQLTLSGSGLVTVSQQAIPSGKDRTLRFVVSALAPGGNATQPVSVGTQ